MQLRPDLWYESFTCYDRNFVLISKETFVMLQGRKSHIKIHEDATGGIYVVGVVTKPVSSLEDVSILWKSSNIIFSVN